MTAEFCITPQVKFKINFTCFERPFKTAEAEVVNARQSDRLLDKILADNAPEGFLDMVVPRFLVTFKFQAGFPQFGVNLTSN